MLNVDLSKLEMALKDLTPDEKFSLPLSDNVIESLLESVEPVEPSANLLSELEEIILHPNEEQITNYENNSLTFGEYIEALEENMKDLLGPSSVREVFYIEVSSDHLKRIKADQIDKVEINDVSQTIIGLCIPFNYALTLLHRSFKVIDLKKRKLFAPSNARTAEELNTEARHKTTFGSMKSLLLSIDKEKQITDIENDWTNFQSKLRKELKHANYI